MVKMNLSTVLVDHFGKNCALVKNGKSLFQWQWKWPKNTRKLSIRANFMFHVDPI